MSFRRRALLVLCAAAMLGRVEAASAATVPPGAVVVVARAIDAAAFARDLSVRYNIELRRVVVADIDHDGDGDVVATTDRDLLVWVNDGRGRLTSQAPRHGPTASGDELGTMRKRRTARDRDTIQTDTQALRPPASRLLAPLVRAPNAAAFANSVRPADSAAGPQSPRAPPAASL